MPVVPLEEPVTVSSRSHRSGSKSQSRQLPSVRFYTAYRNVSSANTWVRVGVLRFGPGSQYALPQDAGSDFVPDGPPIATVSQPVIVYSAGTPKAGSSCSVRRSPSGRKRLTFSIFLMPHRTSIPEHSAHHREVPSPSSHHGGTQTWQALEKV